MNDLLSQMIDTTPTARSMFDVEEAQEFIKSGMIPGKEVHLRLVHVIHCGVRTITFKNKSRTHNSVLFGFEVTGNGLRLAKLADGLDRYPFIHYIDVNDTGLDSSRYAALLRKLVNCTPECFWKDILNDTRTGNVNRLEDFTQPWQLIPIPYLGHPEEKTFTDKDGAKGSTVILHNNQAQPPVYNISSVQYEDRETGELKLVKVAPQKAQSVYMPWHGTEDIPEGQREPMLAMWDSLTRRDEDGKQYHSFAQKNIFAADDFKGSGLARLLADTGRL